MMILKGLLHNMIESMQVRHGIALKFAKDAENFLLEAGYSKKLGVRELQRAVEKHVQEPLSSLLLNGELKQHKSWIISSKDSTIKIVPENH